MGGDAKDKPERAEGAESRRTELDPFVASSVFPDASAVFTAVPIPLAQAKAKACIVLDTNALLVPYGIGPQTLTEVEATYQRLLKEGRLIIPAQVAREYARNRVTKLAELYQRLYRRRSQLQPFQQGTYPLLETLEEYRRLRDMEEQLDRLMSEYRKLLTSVAESVSSWEWNDPVSLLYGRLFGAGIVVEPKTPLDEVRKEHLRRFANRIPPGYKDEAKDDQGIGDFLIWLTILDVGAARKTSVIFVSGEEKSDWWHRSEHQQLYPRYELVDEFRRASSGHSFHIIKFSRLLELFGASTEVVAQVREEERVAAPRTLLSKHSAMQLRSINAERAVASWLVESGYTVSPAPMDSHYDYVVEGPAGAFAVDVVYVRDPIHVALRLRQRHSRRPTALEMPLTVVVVAESDQVLDEAERAWTALDPAFRLSTGLLTSGGRFQVRRPL